MPDVLLTEAGDRLLQEDGFAVLIEAITPGQGGTLRVSGGAAVSPVRIAGALVRPHVAREPRSTPTVGIA